MVAALNQKEAKMANQTTRTARLQRLAEQAIMKQSPSDAVVNYCMALQGFDFPDGRSEDQVQAELSSAEDRLIRTPCDLQGAVFKLQQIARSSASAGGTFGLDTALRWVSDPEVGNEERLLASAWLDINSVIRKAESEAPAVSKHLLAAE